LMLVDLIEVFVEFLRRCRAADLYACVTHLLSPLGFLSVQ
jgi:hypothetical protein